MASVRLCSALWRATHGRRFPSMRSRLWPDDFASVAALNKCPTQAVRALVERAYQNGAHSFFKIFGELLCQRFGGEMAKREHPVRIPPSFFVNAISLTEVRAFEKMLTRMRANCLSASKSDWKGSVSSDSCLRMSVDTPPLGMEMNSEGAS